MPTQFVNLPGTTSTTSTTEDSAQTGEFQSSSIQQLVRLNELMQRILNHHRVITGLESDKGEEY